MPASTISMRSRFVDATIRVVHGLVEGAARGEGPLLEDGQDDACEARLQLAQLVEEEGPAPGGGDQTVASLGVAAREGPRLVTVQLAPRAGWSRPARRKT